MLINQFRGELINNRLFFVGICVELSLFKVIHNRAETATKKANYLSW